MNTIIFKLTKQNSNFWGIVKNLGKKIVFHAKKLNEIFIHINFII
jgi:hypothetical protein